MAQIKVDTGSSARLLKIGHISQEEFLNGNDNMQKGRTFGGQETIYIW